MKRYPAPANILAKAMVIPNGESRRIELATTSFAADEGRLSAGKIDSSPAIPAVMFFCQLDTEFKPTICVTFDLTIPWGPFE